MIDLLLNYVILFPQWKDEETKKLPYIICDYFKSRYNLIYIELTEFHFQTNGLKAKIVGRTNIGKFAVEIYNDGRIENLNSELILIDIDKILKLKSFI